MVLVKAQLDMVKMFMENMPITECITSDAASHLVLMNLTARTSLGMVGMVDLLRLQGGNIARILEEDTAKSNRFDIEVAKKCTAMEK